MYESSKICTRTAKPMDLPSRWNGRLVLYDVRSHSLISNQPKIKTLKLTLHSNQITKSNRILIYSEKHKQLMDSQLSVPNYLNKSLNLI